MEHPICLIENLETGDLVVNPEAERILTEINQPVVVVAIVGKYRTGKSYLMNKLAGKSNGFALGSTIQSKTKGIWMWCLPHPKKPEYTLVLLDTEGLGDVEKQSLAQKTEIYYQRNVDESIRICNALIQDLNGPLETGIKEEKYSKPGGHRLFQQELSRVIEAYNGCLGKGIKAADVLQEFLQEKEKTGAMILQTDQSLTEHEKKIAEQKAKVEAEEREKLIIEEKNQRLQETIELEKKSREEQLRLLHQKYEQEKQKMKEENEWMIQERQKEMEQMMKEGMSHKSDMLQEEIQNLQRQNEATNQESTSDAFDAALPGVLGTLVKKLLSDLYPSKKKPNVQ
uniref:GB1/RHD3-type G domain-containing protein n=1 Tax=Leptobrachium leishanense TaxID=445787 RepID=A0A8C5WMF4_9ANUR